MLTPPTGRRGIKVPVRLADVPPDLREEVADKVIKQWKLRGVEAIAMQFAARAPVQNPSINVDEDKAYRVIVERKQPLGAIPKIGL